jgi:hypothetical protein
MQDALVPLAGWKPPERIIEVGAGMGHHAEMLRKLRFDVTAVELSPAGVAAAKECYPKLDIVCADIATWAPSRHGHVFARGASPWHYELNGVNERGVDVPAVTARCFDWVPPGYSFVLQIVTDLSGTRRGGKQPRETGVWNNTEAAYRQLFERFGDVSITDWSGRPLSVAPDQGVIVVTRRR